MNHEFKKGKYSISTDKRRLQIKIIHGFLVDSYWAKGIKSERIRKGIQNSLCFGVYHNKRQIGFARVITDYTNFGYLADVFIIEEFRDRGLSKWLMKCILSLRELKEMKTWMLATKDAHGLYAKFGFESLKESQRFMRKQNLKYIQR